MKVRHVLYFVVSVIALLGVIMLIFPEDGIRISKNWVLYFPSFEEMFLDSKKVTVSSDSLMNSQIDINEIIPEENINEIDSIDFEELKKSITPLEFPEDNPHALDNFYSKLHNMDKEQRVRVMHYGDSQIEGDRISSFIRSKFQARYGGLGVGLCSPVAIYAQYSLKQANSANWYRYNGFAYSENISPHKKYGPMIAYNRFAPIPDSATWEATTKYSAWLEFSESNLGYSNTKTFKNIAIYYGNSKTKVQIKVISDGHELAVDSLEAGEDLYVYRYNSDTYLNNVRLEFEAYDSPDFYAISLEDDTGVFVDNIALRGSSGTVFTTTDGSLLAKSFAELGVDLFILQFGGNTVPYIEDAKSAERFANHFYYQLAFLKNVVPDVNIIVIGPSDMATKIKDDYQTYPNLENIVDELRKATHRAGCVYWDMYKAMGGENSMIAWVNANPPLASPDFVHFTPNGANVVSNIFYNSLIINYAEYLERAKNAK